MSTPDVNAGALRARLALRPKLVPLEPGDGNWDAHMKSLREQVSFDRDLALTALGIALGWMDESMEFFGPCDHDVGICVCEDKRLIEELRSVYVTTKEGS